MPLHLRQGKGGGFVDNNTGYFYKRGYISRDVRKHGNLAYRIVKSVIPSAKIDIYDIITAERLLYLFMCGTIRGQSPMFGFGCVIPNEVQNLSVKLLRFA